MTATTAHRLERRTDMTAPRRETHAHVRPVEPARMRGRRAPERVSPGTPLRKRPGTQPPPADLAAVARTQLFRARVESTVEVERRSARDRHLRVVPRRRRITSILAPALIVVFLAMLGVTTFQTRMAENQVNLDRLLVKVDKARDLNVKLSRQRAELLSPVRLGKEADRMKMAAPDTVGFVTVDRDTYRAVLEGSSVTGRTATDVGPDATVTTGASEKPVAGKVTGA